MHDGPVVVWASEAVDVARLLEVALPAALDILEIDCHEIIPVWARLLMVEAERVHELVLDDSFVDAAVLLEVERLAARRKGCLSDVRPAAAFGRDRDPIGVQTGVVRDKPDNPDVVGKIFQGILNEHSLRT